MRAVAMTHPKLAEKLTILNDRGIGMLTRIYNIKKTCSDPKLKPTFLMDKSMESIIKHAVRKFPNISDYKANAQFQIVNQNKENIMKNLALYYNTFVDLLEFKDHVVELLTTIDACLLSLDITVNYDLTKSYLDLVVTYVSIMVLLSRVDDRKAVLSLYNIAYDMTNGHPDTSYPRLGQMIIEYEVPLKKLSEEFVPHSKSLHSALLSLKDIFIQRNVDVTVWRSKHLFSLIAEPDFMVNPVITDTAQCSYLSIDAMERYVIFGFLLIHQFLSEAETHKLFLNALQCGWVLPLFRDEVLFTHNFVQVYFESHKGYSKRVSEVKDAFNYVQTKSPNIHRERRKFLRTALKELALLFADQPGLLGPKALFVFNALAYARDEVHWLLRHSENHPPRSNKSKVSAEDLIDRQLPELLFYIEELRGLVRKYSQVIQLYHIQYLYNYDAYMLEDISKNTSSLPEEDSLILDSVYTSISSVRETQLDTELFDFRALRLDWFRLQAYASGPRYSLQLIPDHSKLALCMNQIVYHTKMIDHLDHMLNETSDLSIFCFSHKVFEDQFRLCLEFPAQTRFIIAFPLICGHFLNCVHELCPEERYAIGDRSIHMVNLFLDEMTKEAKNIITTICDDHCFMSDKLLPKNATTFAKQKKLKLKGGKNSLPNLNGSGNVLDMKGTGSADEPRPGMESYRRTREELTTMDKLYMALTELCYAINHKSSIQVWEHSFCPREYLTQNLEHRFNRSLVNMTMYNDLTKEIAKPSEMLASVRSYMNVLQSIESFVHIDITRVFNNVLLQQSQQYDVNGEKTIAHIYTNWYLEVLLRKVSSGHIVYAPRQKAFVSLAIDQQMPFSAEEYSDINELRALIELIGPYGVDGMVEKIMWHIASQITELKRIVIANVDTLREMRYDRYDQPEQMRELFKKLNDVDSVLQRMTIVGEMMCFRSLLQEALRDVLEERIPFLLGCIKDFYQSANSSMVESMSIDPHSLKVVDEMAGAAGIECRVDSALVNALRIHNKSELSPPEQHEYACLLMVFVAVSLPKLARLENSVYRPDFEAHTNNIHCLAKAINGIAAALFSLNEPSNVEERLKEFLALASSSLLRLGQETADKDAIKNRESIYILLDLIVQESPFLTMDLLESCFPYALIRNAYHEVHKNIHVVH